jgi:hypothetical protein
MVAEKLYLAGIPVRFRVPPSAQVATLGGAVRRSCRSADPRRAMRNEPFKTFVSDEGAAADPDDLENVAVDQAPSGCGTDMSLCTDILDAVQAPPWRGRLRCSIWLHGFTWN